MRSFHLARQLLRRDWRSGELTTLFFALFIAVTAVLTISLVTDRLTAGMAKESAELIGGDLVIRSTREPEPSWQESAVELGLATARVYDFNSVLFRGDEMLMCSIKAVSKNYPLLGKLKTKQSIQSEEVEVEDLPKPGTAWVDARVLEQLNAKIGDEVAFGAINLKIAGILSYEPDQGNNLFQFSPRVLINESELEPAQVLGPGSRIRYRTFFAGNGSSGNQLNGNYAKAMATLKARIEPQLGTGHTLIEPNNQESRPAAALLNATQYIRIATLLTIVLAAIAIGLTARRYSERHYDVSAMLRCLGARQQEILKLYIYQLLLLTSFAVVLAGIFGWLFHELILLVLQSLLPPDLPAPGAAPWLAACGSAFLLIAGFALPPLIRLADTPPLRVLRRDLNPVPLSVWLVYGIAGVTQMALLWLLFDDLPNILLTLLFTAISLLVVGLMVFIGLRGLRGRSFRRRNMFTRSIRNLAAHTTTSTSQIMAFGITLMLLLVIFQLRTGLLDQWQLQLPEKAPNHFVFNLFPDQLESFTQLVEPKVKLEPLYPVVRGRMTAINNDSVAVEKGGDDNRELNLTWTNQLPKDNEILEGSWPPVGNGISIEAGYAERLNVKMGDKLQFNISGQIIDAEISSIRSVIWESLSPNFFLVFSEPLLAPMPTTYLTSFYLESKDKTLLKQLARQFPAMSIIEVGSLLKRLQQVLRQVSLSVELMMLFVLLSGFAVLFATLQTTADERIQEGALMRSFGASRRYLRNAYLVEFGLLGFCAGLLAIGGAEISCAIIYERVFEIHYAYNPVLWLLVPPMTGLLVAFAGFSGSRKVLQVSPLRLLTS